MLKQLIWTPVLSSDWSCSLWNPGSLPGVFLAYVSCFLYRCEWPQFIVSYRWRTSVRDQISLTQWFLLARLLRTFTCSALWLAGVCFSRCSICNRCKYRPTMLREASRTVRAAESSFKHSLQPFLFSSGVIFVLGFSDLAPLGCRWGAVGCCSWKGSFVLLCAKVNAAFFSLLPLLFSCDLKLVGAV